MDPKEREKRKKHIEEQLVVIGAIAFSGLLNNKLLFLENEFNSCHGAMEIACHVGVLSRQKKLCSSEGYDRHGTPCSLKSLFSA